MGEYFIVSQINFWTCFPLRTFIPDKTTSDINETVWNCFIMYYVACLKPY